VEDPQQLLSSLRKALSFTPGDLKKQKKVRGVLNIVVGGGGSTAVVELIEDRICASHQATLKSKRRCEVC